MMVSEGANTCHQRSQITTVALHGGLVDPGHAVVADQTKPISVTDLAVSQKTQQTWFGRPCKALF